MEFTGKVLKNAPVTMIYFSVPQFWSRVAGEGSTPRQSYHTDAQPQHR